MTGDRAYRPSGGYPDHRAPTPWAAGLTVLVVVAALTCVGVYAFGVAMARGHPLLAILINGIAAICLTPSVFSGSKKPVTRWVVGGAVTGVLLAWIGLVVTGLAAVL
ncbi:DUF2537 domain-containing protein [Nocardia takedensis]|uniref:DUF2537 domain-containing protein n=1 Tax=Nocardia takedensis TaxID=259390 RepID=UPI00030D051D|nr:DUF2537 domain-containing protein [Nocardia takedensis]